MEANSIKKVVAMGIGAAVYIVLSRFAAIPTPIPTPTPTPTKNTKSEIIINKGE